MTGKGRNDETANREQKSRASECFDPGGLPAHGFDPAAAEQAQKAALTVGIVLSVFYLLVLLQLAAAFRAEARVTPYSYDTIYYIGFALFVFSVLVTHVVLTVRMMGRPEVYDAQELLRLLQGSAKQYM